MMPSTLPSTVPSNVPTYLPSDKPSAIPSFKPSKYPSLIPSSYPSMLPSIYPSNFPSKLPSEVPTTTLQDYKVEGIELMLFGIDHLKPYERISLQLSTERFLLNFLSSGLTDILFVNVAMIITGTSFKRNKVVVEFDANLTFYSSFRSALMKRDMKQVLIDILMTHRSMFRKTLKLQTKDITKMYVKDANATPLPSTSPSTLPSLTPSAFPSDMPSSIPSSIPSSLPSYQPTSLPSDMPSEGIQTETVEGILLMLFGISKLTLVDKAIVKIVIDNLLLDYVTDFEEIKFEKISINYKNETNLNDGVLFVLDIDILFNAGYRERLLKRNMKKELINIILVHKKELMTALGALKKPVTAMYSTDADMPDVPSMIPSSQPSSLPSLYPSFYPSHTPSSVPSDTPSDQPHFSPSLDPSKSPSMKPTNNPTASPSLIPSSIPTSDPSKLPTSQPSIKPSMRPSKSPTDIPTGVPSLFPSDVPSTRPSYQPSSECHDVKDFVSSSGIRCSDIGALLSISGLSCKSLGKFGLRTGTIDEITSNCPRSCKYCALPPSTAPSEIPSTLPSDSPTLSPTMCTDSKSFQTALGLYCTDINEISSFVPCNQMTVRFGWSKYELVEVMANCPRSCNLCSTPTLAIFRHILQPPKRVGTPELEQVVTPSPTQLPSASPSDTCEDSSRFASKIGFSCRDLKQFTLLIPCKDFSQLGWTRNDIKLFMINCPVTCHSCKLANENNELAHTNNQF
uniref:ShKT domain-containing protein n=1 Tax=Corethron hystrix TaxID=216773 RepID=A0A7S1B7R0_9STRA